MAGTVNAQITDAITQTNVSVLGESAASAMGTSSQVMAHANGLSMENAAQAQGGIQQMMNAATAGFITMIVKAMPGPPGPAQAEAPQNAPNSSPGGQSASSDTNSATNQLAPPASH